MHLDVPWAQRSPDGSGNPTGPTAKGRKSEHRDGRSHVAPSCTRSPGATQPGQPGERQARPSGLPSLRPRPGASSLSVPPATWALPSVLPQGGSQERVLPPGARTCGHTTK